MSKVIIVDIQPAYLHCCRHIVGKGLKKYLEDKEVLFLYNQDTAEEYLFEIEDMWRDYVGIEISEEFECHRKEHGFLRGWMDNGVDEDIITSVLAYMLENQIDDSRDLKPEMVKELECEEAFNLISPIHVSPYMQSINFWYWQHAEIIGGGIDQCLKEVQLWLDALGIQYIPNYQYIY